ncbi:urea active transporter [Mariannaea sp. PMI_226]|nr:urea active transporter [Mariannaea sp. PMI_226]
MLAQRSDAGGEIASPLPQSVGYGIVVLFGLAFAFGMIGVTALLKRTTGEDNAKVETFMVANRRVRTGLIASAVVSSWLWSTALLSCVLVTYAYGISGAFWYAAGCSPMIVFFAYLGVICKKRIPEAHTILEIIRIRYGTTAHLSFTFLAVVNNLFNTVNMILGASAVISFLTGMHIMASTFLLPLGVVLYTLVGGIKATFLTDYLHTFVILILSCYLTLKALTSEQVGSLGGLYDLVVAAQENHNIDGNYKGSLLTMTSQQGIFFAIILLVSNFGAVIMDTGYFIKAFAASPRAVVPGYVIGGVSYFSVPWSLGTIMGMAALGLESSPIFPTYPRAMTSTEVTNGLALPYVAIAVAGKGGAVAVLLMTFMAVTSTLSAQIIAVSSIITFDVYRTYFNKNAGNKEVIRWSHIGVILFGSVSAGFTAMFHYVGIDMGWTLYMIGVVTCPGVVPVIFTILWRKQSTIAVVGSAFLGMATGLAVWLGTAYKFFGEVSVSSTGQTLPCMYGTVASALSPLLYTIVMSLIRPANYDWSDFKQEKLVVEVDSEDDKQVQTPGKTANNSVSISNSSEEPAEDDTHRRWTRYALFWSVATFLGHWVLWPLPMYAANYIFSKTFFVAWNAVSLIWLWLSLIVIGIYPIWDGRDQLLAVFNNLRLRGSRGD